MAPGVAFVSLHQLSPRLPRNGSLHGDAQWFSRTDLQPMQLLGARVAEAVSRAHVTASFAWLAANTDFEPEAERLGLFRGKHADLWVH
jgi:hypothetical protein